MTRCVKLIRVSRSKDEIAKVIDGIELLYELRLLNPTDKFWGLFVELVEKQVKLIKIYDSSTHNSDP